MLCHSDIMRTADQGAAVFCFFPLYCCVENGNIGLPVSDVVDDYVPAYAGDNVLVLTVSSEKLGVT